MMPGVARGKDMHGRGVARKDVAGGPGSGPGVMPAKAGPAEECSEVATGGEGMAPAAASGGVRLPMVLMSMPLAVRYALTLGRGSATTGAGT